MRKATIFLVLAFLLGFCAAPAYAVPALPHAFYGSVEINGSAAPDGTEVSATVDNGTVIPTQNPVTTVGGSYGIDSPRLLVQGDISPLATITFYVKGVSTGQTAIFEAGGGPTKRDLSVTIPSAGPSYAAAIYLQTNLFGIEERYRISRTGKIVETIETTSEDGMLTITIPEGTIALDEDGDPLDTLEVSIDKTPPDPPEDTYIIGLAYDFEPDGAAFDPPITLTWSYDPDALPRRVAEEDLVIAYYDEAVDEWVEVDCVVDTKNDTITASVEYFATFAILGAITPLPLPAPAAFSVSNLSVQPAEVQPKEAVTITVSVANTGGTEGSYTVVLKIDGVKEAEQSVTVAAGESVDVSFIVTKEEARTYSTVVDGLSAFFRVVAPVLPPTPPPPAPPVAPPVNLPVIGGIIAGVLVVALLIIFLVVRRRAY